MKKNILFTVMAFFMGLIATSCSQDEIISNNGNAAGGVVSVAVNIPVNNPVTRAVPNIPDGYKLRCILQLMKADGSGAIANGRFVQEVLPEHNGKITFTFTAPSEDYKCCFWADYVKNDVTDIAAAEADYIYNTADLRAIDYTSNAGQNMFGNDVADAFYACSLSPVSGTGTLPQITLIRPFTKITFKDRKNAYAEYAKIQVTNLPAPTGFDVMAGTTKGYAGKGDYTSNTISSPELAINNGEWFSTYLFTSTSGSALGTGNDIEFTLKKEAGETTNLKINGESITLTQNADVTAEVEPVKEGGDTSIDVTFPGGMEDPNKMAVGDFIYADGTFGKEAQDAIAIVYALADKATGDNSDYGENKTVAGYAVALDKATSRTSFKNETGNDFPQLTSTAETETESPYSGYSLTQTFNTTIAEYAGSKVIAAYTTWLESHQINATSLSQWYYPSYQQVVDFITQAVGTNEIPANEKIKGAISDNLNNAYNATNGNSTFYFMASSINNDSTIKSITYKKEDSSISLSGKVNPNNHQVVIWPFLTIFEDAAQ